MPKQSFYLLIWSGLISAAITILLAVMVTMVSGTLAFASVIGSLDHGAGTLQNGPSPLSGPLFLCGLLALTILQRVRKK